MGTFCRAFVLATLLALPSLACLNNSNGNGIGRPAVPPATDPNLKSLSIVQIGPTSTPPFAQLVNNGNEVVDLTGLRLVKSLDPNTPPGAFNALDGNLQVGERRWFNVTSLALQGSAGELAVLDPNAFVVHTYVSWGNAPEAWDSGLAHAALSDGAVKPGAFVALPFPLPPGVAIANDPNGIVGCTSPDPNRLTVQPDDAGCLAPAASNPNISVAITELMPAVSVAGAIDPNTSWIEITNLGAAAINLYGTRLCYRGGCNVMTEPLELDAAASGTARALVHLGMPKPATDALQHYSLGTEVLLPQDEIALLTPGFSDTTGPLTNILSYVRLGPPDKAPAALVALAYSQGRWSVQGGSVTVSIGAGQSLAVKPEGSTDPAAWTAGTPTPLAPN